MLKQDGAKPLPFFYVGSKITNERIARFISNKHALLSEKLGKPDTKAVWYTRDHIAKLVEEMDKTGADGLRIYLGEYGEDENYNGQLCLLMVMTKADLETGVRQDVTIEETPDFTARSFDGTGTRDFNVGAPCPPLC